MSHNHGIGCRTCYERLSAERRTDLESADEVRRWKAGWEVWHPCVLAWENEHGPERAVVLIALREPILAAHRAFGDRLEVKLYPDAFASVAHGIGEFLAAHEGHALEPCADHGRFTDATGEVLCDRPGCRHVTDCWTCPEHGQ